MCIRDRDEAVRTRQVWTRLLALLEQMHEIAGGARIPGSTVAAWIEAMCIRDRLG